MKRFRNLTGIVAMCVILGATLFVPATNATTVNLKLSVSRSGDSNTFNFRTYFPITAEVSVNNSAPGSTFFWQFGDGSNSTDSTPTHVYSNPCVYNIQVQVTASNGSVTSGTLAFGAFDTAAPQGRTLAVCPPQGTEGIVPVELAGGYFTPNQQVNVLMDGASMTTVTAGKGGDWILDVSSYLTPEPNGTQFTFTTSPSSITSFFTTLEGVRATPGSGAPGTSVQLEGRSYLPYSTVLVYLGGASIGTAVTDENGSFLSSFQIPFVSPLTQAGTYPYATFPAILGSQANFVSAGVTTTTTQSTTQTVTQTTTQLSTTTKTMTKPTTVTQPTTQTEITTQSTTVTQPTTVTESTIVTQSTTQTEITIQPTTTTTTTTTTSLSTSTTSTYAYVLLGATAIVIVTVASLAAWVLRGRKP